MQQLIGTADVTEMTGVEERFDQFGHRPIAPLQEYPHVGPAPDQGAGGASPEDSFALVAVGQQLADVAGQESAIRFGQYQQLPTGLGQAATRGPAVALTRLVDLARGGLGHFLAGARFRIVVDDEDLVDQAGGEKALDGGADRAPLGIRHQNHRDALPLPHPFPPGHGTRKYGTRPRTTHRAMSDRSLAGSQNHDQRAACSGRRPPFRTATSRLVQSAACETESASMPTGRVTTKRVPPSVGKSARICPPCSSTICRLTYRSSPSPCVASSGRAWKKRSKIRSRASIGIPMPRSLTASATIAGVGRESVTTIGAPWGLCL